MSGKEWDPLEQSKGKDQVKSTSLLATPTEWGFAKGRSHTLDPF